MIFSKFINRVFRLDIDAYFLFRSQNKKMKNYPALPERYDFVEITCDDLTNGRFDSLYDAVGRDFTAEYFHRWECGDKCFGIKVNNTVIAMAWVGFENSPKRKTFANFLNDLESGLLAYDEFVHPEFRGERLQILLRQKCFEFFSGVDCLYWYVFVGVKNMASLLNMQRLYSERKLVYHATLEIPKLKYNFYPKKNSESWVELKNYER